jgi:hypothetical protein
MVREGADAMVMGERPRMPLSCLRDLRLELDVYLSSLRDDSRLEGDQHAARPERRSGPLRL